MGCGSITRGSVVEDCADIPPGGTRARLLLANKSEITGYTYNGDGEITAITFAASAGFYEFTGYRTNEIGKTEEVIKPELGPAKFKHGTKLIVYENTQIQKNNIESMVKGSMVALIENNGNDANSFELLGKDVGLSVVAGPIRDANTNGGYFVINLATPDDEGVLEGELATTVTLASGYTANLAAIDALIIAPS